MSYSESFMDEIEQIVEVPTEEVVVEPVVEDHPTLVTDPEEEDEDEGVLPEDAPAEDEEVTD